MSKPAYEIVDIPGTLPPPHKPVVRAPSRGGSAPAHPTAPARIGHGLGGVHDEQAMAAYHTAVRDELDAYAREQERVARQAVGINAYAPPTPAVKPWSPGNGGWQKNSIPEWAVPPGTNRNVPCGIRNPSYIMPRTQLEFLRDEARKIREELWLAKLKSPGPPADRDLQVKLQAKYEAMLREIAQLEATDPTHIREREIQAMAAAEYKRAQVERARNEAEKAKAEWEGAKAKLADLEGSEG